MAANQTQNYGLNQWKLSDSVIMAEFNADNQKVDEALAALNKRIDTAVADADQKVQTALAAATQKINTATQTLNASIAAVTATVPHVQTGTYVGTGTYGEANPNTLTFDFIPKLVIVNNVIFLDAVMNEHDGYEMVAIQGARRCWCDYRSTSSAKITLQWSGNSFSWYGNTSSEQGNIADATYHYIAIG